MDQSGSVLRRVPQRGQHCPGRSALSWTVSTGYRVQGWALILTTPFFRSIGYLVVCVIRGDWLWRLIWRQP